MSDENKDKEGVYAGVGAPGAKYSMEPLIKTR